MSNINEGKKLDPLAENPEVESMTGALRGDGSLQGSVGGITTPNKFMAKPVIHVEDKDKPLTHADIIALSETMEKKFRESLQNGTFEATLNSQALPKHKVPVTDFAALTMDDVYNLEVNIEAKPFMSADVLLIRLRDSNYEARWVNKHPQRLGDMISKGFTYITKKDLIPNETEAIQTSLDAEGHYSINDVVAMKIDKATYYSALRAAYERAVKTTNQTLARKSAVDQANGYMSSSDVRGDYNNATVQGKMKFYDPGVQV